MSTRLTPMHMSNNRNYEPQRTNHFEIVISGIPGSSASRNLTLAVNTFSKPNISNDPIEVARGNSRIKYAGQASFAGAESLEVIDYIGLDIEQIVNNWHKQVYDPESGAIGFAANYKKKAIIREFAPDGTEVRTWTLEGVWPSGVAYGDSLTYDGSEVKKVMITIAYDRAMRD